MTPIDGITLDERLAEVYESLAKAPPTAKAMKVWFQTLKEFPIQDIVAVLDEWIKRNRQTPVPADVWKILNDQRCDAIEAESAIRKRKEQADIAQFHHHTDIGSQTIRKTLAALARSNNHGHRLWASKILERHSAGDRTVTPYQLSLARKAGQKTVDTQKPDEIDMSVDQQF